MIDKTNIKKRLKNLDDVGVTKYILDDGKEVSFDLKDLLVECFMSIDSLLIDIEKNEDTIEEMQKTIDKMVADIETLQKDKV